MERITGDTKHTGSELKICQKTIYLVLKVSHENMLVSVLGTFVQMDFRNILRAGK